MRSTWGTRLSANSVSAARSSRRRDALQVQVGGRDLRALEERHRRAVVGRDVAPAGQRGQPLGQRDGRAAAAAGEREEGAVVLGADVRAELAQRGRVQRHQLVPGVLAAERRRRLGGVHARQLVRGPRPAGAQPRLDRAEARERRARLRSVGNQPEPKLTASSWSAKAARASSVAPGDGLDGAGAGGRQRARVGGIAASTTCTCGRRRPPRAHAERISSGSAIARDGAASRSPPARALA